jgi:hypothetical protein
MCVWYSKKQRVVCVCGRAKGENEKLGIGVQNIYKMCGII